MAKLLKTGRLAVPRLSAVLESCGQGGLLLHAASAGCEGTLNSVKNTAGESGNSAVWMRPLGNAHRQTGHEISRVH